MCLCMEVASVPSNPLHRGEEEKLRTQVADPSGALFPKTPPLSRHGAPGTTRTSASPIGPCRSLGSCNILLG